MTDETTVSASDGAKRYKVAGTDLSLPLVTIPEKSRAEWDTMPRDAIMQIPKVAMESLYASSQKNIIATQMLLTAVKTPYIGNEAAMALFTKMEKLLIAAQNNLTGFVVTMMVARGDDPVPQEFFDQVTMASSEGVW